MLVLSRKKGEQILLRIPQGFSGEIAIDICDVRKPDSGDKSYARIGITAPKEVHIVRSEIKDNPR
jgi:carbon storage regulator CsrA